MLLVGLTGGIGAGKSTVAGVLADLGAVVLDADAVAREVVEPGTPAFTALIEQFGQEIVGPDGSLDRPRLAEIAFATDASRLALESITHPAIHAEFGRQMSSAPIDAILVMDVPLLVESGTAAERGYEAVIVVESPREVRLDRLEQRGLGRSDAEARMAAQATDAERRLIATYVVDNSGDLAGLTEQVQRIWIDLERRHAEKH
ncbi:MAG: dephospho-CoA kinase [Acidimicrobiia bacterium]|nr:dephospho-CoA kinase [Acidimicrobiia bacterium]